MSSTERLKKIVDRIRARQAQSKDFDEVDEVFNEIIIDGSKADIFSSIQLIEDMFIDADDGFDEENIKIAS